MSPFIWGGRFPSKPSMGGLIGRGMGEGMLEEMERQKQIEPAAAQMLVNLWYQSDKAGQGQMVASPGWKERVVPLLSKFGIPTTPEGKLPSRQDPQAYEKLGLALQVLQASGQLPVGLPEQYKKITGYGWPEVEKVTEEPTTGYTPEEWAGLGGGPEGPPTEKITTRGPWKPMSREEELTMALQSKVLEKALEVPFEVQKFKETHGEVEKEKAKRRREEFDIKTILDMRKQVEEIRHHQAEEKLSSERNLIEIGKITNKEQQDLYKDFSADFDRGSFALNKSILSGGIEDRKGEVRRLEGVFRSYASSLPKKEYTFTDKAGKATKEVYPDLRLLRASAEKMAGIWVTELIALGDDRSDKGEAFRDETLASLNKLLKLMPMTQEQSEFESRILNALLRTGNYTLTKDDEIVYTPKRTGWGIGSLIKGAQEILKYR